MFTAERDGAPSMGIWENGKHVRELTKEDIELLEQQQQEMMYGEEMEGEQGESEQDDDLEEGEGEELDDGE